MSYEIHRCQASGTKWKRVAQYMTFPQAMEHIIAISKHFDENGSVRFRIMEIKDGMMQVVYTKPSYSHIV